MIRYNAGVKLQSELTVNGKKYNAGDEVSWTLIYPFFLLHMAIFGGSGFFMAYATRGPEEFFLYLHGGFAIFIYLMFYLSIFGKEEVKWMLINAALGVYGIYVQIDWLLSFFDKTVDSYPWHVHVIPFLYYVLYTFLLRQAVIDIVGAREDKEKRRAVERWYVVGSVVVYSAFYLM